MSDSQLVMGAQCAYLMPLGPHLRVSVSVTTAHELSISDFTKITVNAMN